MKTKHFCRTSRRFLSAWHKSARCNIKPRRLIVERIEDRLLLAGDFQAGMELQLNDPNGIDSGFIAIQDNSSKAIILSNDDPGISIGYVNQIFNNSGTITNDISVISCHFNNNAFPLNDGIVAIRLVEGDFPSVNPGKGDIDIGSLYPKSVYSPNNPTFAQQPTPQPVAESKEFPAPILKGNITPKDVDGASGRSQVFELAMATGRESKSVAMPLPDKMADAPRWESKLETMSSPNGLEKETSDVAKLAETQSAHQPANLSSNLSAVASLLESKSAGPQLPKEILSGAQPEIKLAAAQLENNSANEAGLVRSATHQQPILERHATQAKEDFVGSLSHDSQAGQSEPGLAGEGSVASTLPEQSSDSADVSRQAVFAEIGQKAERSMSLPTYLDEKHRTKVVGLAVVAIAGQFLVEKQRHQTATSQTCLIPPRRRGSLN